MGLISRVSSRTYRFFILKDKKKPKNSKMSGDYNTRVYVTPSSIATIVDAHERRGGEGDAVKKYVIGTCIGNIEGNNTYIDQVFMVNYNFEQLPATNNLFFNSTS